MRCWSLVCQFWKAVWGKRKVSLAQYSSNSVSFLDELQDRHSQFYYTNNFKKNQFSVNGASVPFLKFLRQTSSSFGNNLPTAADHASTTPSCCFRGLSLCMFNCVISSEAPIPDPFKRQHALITLSLSFLEINYCWSRFTFLEPPDYAVLRYGECLTNQE